jgi:valine dehydrogenase (NAD+)
MYAPDFVVNAGGVINIAEELSPAGYHRERAYAAIRRIYDTTTAVLDTAKQEGITSAEAASGLAERRMAALGHVQRIRTFSQGEGQWPR